MQIIKLNVIDIIQEHTIADNENMKSRFIPDIPHELRVNFLFVKFLNEKIFLPKILQHFHFKIA